MPRGQELFAAAAAAAARLVETERYWTENQLRQCLIKSLLDTGDVVDTAPVYGSNRGELRPPLPGWPSDPKKPLGGFDLAVRVHGDEEGSWRYYAELKWAPLWEQLWDAMKLCHATRLSGVEDCFICAIATEREWKNEVDGTDLFRANSVTSVPHLLLDKYPVRFAKLLKDSAKSRPRMLPASLRVNRLADVPLETKYGPSRLRVACVRPGGEWLPVNEEGWPVAPEPVVHILSTPEPGPGMAGGSDDVWLRPGPPPQISDPTLKPEDVPPPDASWSRICWFAEQMNGYEEFGTFSNLAAVANLAVEFWNRIGEMPWLDLRDLRGCLFFESRRYRHFGHAPEAASTPYIRGLVEAIRSRVEEMNTPP